MKERITLRVILEHIQASKNDLQRQIIQLDAKFTGKFDALDAKFEGKLARLERQMIQGFEDARLHRQALQEDLEETMRVQSKHARQLNRIRSV